ncbi:MAG TPA: signal peptidase I [Verrucomicrobiae bacterium]|nr:signal peptidase I [Verrucomicrobiae bacterium]
MSASPVPPSVIKLLWLASMVLAILPIALGAGLTILHVRGERLLNVQTASMVPVFRPGDAIVTQSVQASHLRTGDIIAYRSLADPDMTITHRLIGREPDGRLVTAGDALHDTDRPFPARLIIGRATAVAPRLGRVLDLLCQPPGLVIFVYLPAAGIIAAELVRLRRSGRPAYLVHWRYATKG